jgi:membrane protease YdiL (CAAX protease family)
VPRRPLGENGHPQWSISAMAIAAILTSVPFAWVHAAQTGYSLGPFVLLVGVSLVLCTVRLYTRSLASSVLVHICYNFLIFTVTLVFTGGFRHLEKL